MFHLFLDDASVERGVKGLQSAAGFIQSTIAKKVSIYRFPKLTFVADFSMKEGYKMVQKLNALENESRQVEISQNEQNAREDQE